MRTGLRVFLQALGLLSILAIFARAFLRALQICTETFTVLPHALIVLACTTSSENLRAVFLSEGIGAFFQRGFDGHLSHTSHILLNV
jgi:hypothetical protein